MLNNVSLEEKNVCIYGYNMFIDLIQILLIKSTD